MTKQYFLNRQVVIFPYDKNWPQKFAQEKAAISTVICGKNAIVEHVGSTAVPGLAAKPIVDVMVGIADLSCVLTYIEPLASIGYEYVPELEKNIPERRFFHKGPNLPNKHFHLHMAEIGGDFWRKQLLFRNYLRECPETAKSYEQLKGKLAKQYQTDVTGYCEAKTDFIRKVLLKC